MLIMTAFLAAAGLFDHLTHRIPNILTGLMLICCIALRISGRDPAAVSGAVIRIVLTGAAFYPVFAIGALGAGDIKLMAVCAGFLEGSRCLYFIFFSLLMAAVFGTAVMLIRGQMKKRMYRLLIYIKRLLETGRPERYHAGKSAERGAGVAMAGAMFVSAVLGIGGLY
ncbi:MAG: prepilin peptidase [Lachnospiraceae bacterium]|nr:prepilin peptidase [Lachnospiraceae bacterium]MBP1586235.1 prepilin peptidase [Lachnospiraceae bacterium]